MTKIIGVKFKPTGKMYYFNPLDFNIKQGDKVIVETGRGPEYGDVAFGIKEIDEKNVVKPLKDVIRIATQEDTSRYNENKQKEKEAFSICLEKIKKHNLDMKLIEVEYTFDGSKILFYFTSDGRVDFRELVKDLASVFRTRIELRQIGVRDESKTLGSIGVCGRNLCCSQFLDEFMPVSIKMAKEQGLSLNPSKISGACGRLMCCLKYEQDMYEEFISESPAQGASVITPDGSGTVVSVALLKGKVKVKLDNDDDINLKEYNVSDVKTCSKKSDTEEHEESESAPEELSPTPQPNKSKFPKAGNRSKSDLKHEREEKMPTAEGEEKKKRKYSYYQNKRKNNRPPRRKNEYKNEQ